MSDVFSIDAIFGSVQLVSERKRIGDKIYLGGYSIHRDRYGRETKRTETVWSGVLACGSELEAQRLMRVCQ